MDTHDGSTPIHPRVTRAYAKSLIVKEKYHVDKELLIVICKVELKSEHRLIGSAIMADANSFTIERGKAIARKKVLDKIVELEMYLLRSMLSKQKGK